MTQLKQLSKRRQGYWLMVAGFMMIGLVWGLFQLQSTNTIGIVEKVQVLQRQPITSSYQNHDQQITQRLQVRLVTGPKRGQRYQVRNRYMLSQAVTNRYFVGTPVVVQRASASTLILLGPQRSASLLVLLSVLLFVLVAVLRQSGLVIIISAVLNSLWFVAALLVMTHWQNQHMLLITSGAALLMTLGTGILVFGLSRQTKVALSATLISILLTLGISLVFLTLSHDQGLHYETLAYGVQPYKTVFIAETILGLLGAVMDETTDITASIEQLMQENPDLKPRQLYQSGLQVGREIVGPLVNILFYLFLAELMPLIILYLRNGNTLQFTLSRTMSLGYTQTVISAIGIVVAVPITAILAEKWLQGESK